MKQNIGVLVEGITKELGHAKFVIMSISDTYIWFKDKLYNKYYTVKLTGKGRVKKNSLKVNTLGAYNLYDISCIKDCTGSLYEVMRINMEKGEFTYETYDGINAHVSFKELSKDGYKFYALRQVKVYSK